ncbi:hypothetical protein KAX01_01680 [Candidatus Bathyarchaeota archaeon]|nr:hypothetical protein [Candidatus Bathyarchaeota archaeon]MCK4435339.1 hypothetical protein [Candidatus Bathyarchaeota archaeon]
MAETGKKRNPDILVQGGLAIFAGVIYFTVLFLPWLSGRSSAISGLADPQDQAAIAIPMILILLSIMTIFGGALHIARYELGIQLATLMSAIAFFISVMVIIITLFNENLEINLLLGPWICAAGAILGTLSSKLKRKVGSNDLIG